MGFSVLMAFCHQPLVFFFLHDCMTQNYTISRGVWTSQWSDDLKGICRLNLAEPEQWKPKSQTQPQSNSSLYRKWPNCPVLIQKLSVSFLKNHFNFVYKHFLYFTKSSAEYPYIASGITIQPPFLINCQTPTHVTASQVVWTAQWSNDFDNHVVWTWHNLKKNPHS